MEELKQGLKAATAFIDNVPNIMDGLIKQYVDKYGNEDICRKYVECILKGKTKEAEKLLKKLDNGE